MRTLVLQQQEQDVGSKWPSGSLKVVRPLFGQFQYDSCLLPRVQNRYRNHYCATLPLLTVVSNFARSTTVCFKKVHPYDFHDNNVKWKPI